MVFTKEQDSFLLMAHFRSGTRNEDGVWSYSLQSCIQQFDEAFPDANIPYDVFVNRRSVIVTRFETKHCICKGKSTRRPTVLTLDTIDDIQHRMDVSPNKSVAAFSAQTGLSLGTCHKALRKSLHMHAYKVTVIQDLRPLDNQQRITYCQWFNETLNNNEVLDLTFFTDEAWFHLSGYVSQNYRTWTTENPHIYVETSLHPTKVGVWVGMSRRRIIGPIFFYETITAERYRSNIIDQFLQDVHDDELQRGYFQQDGATAHTAARTLRYLQEFYGDRIIRRGLWPPRSPDLTLLDFYLFGRIKTNIYKNRLHTLDDLENSIRQEIDNITVEELQRVFDNMKRRVNLCLEVVDITFNT